MQRDFPERVQAAAASARKHGAMTPKVGLVLGSGLSDLVDQLLPADTGRLSIAYGEITGFGATSVIGPCLGSDALSPGTIPRIP